MNRRGGAEKQGPTRKIWTIGHSSRTSRELIETLEAYGVDLLADVRRFPNSRNNAQFNQTAFATELLKAGIDYAHFPDLGGRRRPRTDSHNTAWKNTSFRGYADYMETVEFEQGIGRLIEAAHRRHVAVMCAEALWWRCHRRLISDYLVSVGVEVVHIMTTSDSRPHPLSGAARIVEGKLSYATGVAE